MRERFSLEVEHKDACRLIWRAYAQLTAERGFKAMADEPTLEHIRQAAAWLIDPFGKPGMLLYGIPGNGKTTMARALQHCINRVTEAELGYDKRIKGRFVTAQDVVDMAFDKDRTDYKRLKNEELLIIDDLGEEPLEVVVYGQPMTPTVNLLMDRYATQRMTIVTSNLTESQLEGKYKARLYDRMKEMMELVLFTNASYRGRVVK